MSEFQMFVKRRSIFVSKKSRLWYSQLEQTQDLSQGKFVLLFAVFAYTVTVDCVSLYNGFISHSQPKTWPEVMFVSNAVKQLVRWWRMSSENIFSIFPCLRLMQNVWDLSGHTQKLIGEACVKSGPQQTEEWWCYIRDFITYALIFRLPYCMYL